MSDRDIFWHLAAADRETLLSGVFVWLLDPKGSHNLGRRVLDSMWSRAGMPDGPPANVVVQAEHRLDRSRRIDVSVRDGAMGLDAHPLLVLEVKCKTRGTVE
jgi:hypothetical protein